MNKVNIRNIPSDAVKYPVTSRQKNLVSKHCQWSDIEKWAVYIERLPTSIAIDNRTKPLLITRKGKLADYTLIISFTLMC